MDNPVVRLLLLSLLVLTWLFIAAAALSLVRELADAAAGVRP